VRACCVYCERAVYRYREFSTNGCRTRYHVKCYTEIARCPIHAYILLLSCRFPFRAITRIVCSAEHFISTAANIHLVDSCIALRHCVSLRGFFLSFSVHNGRSLVARRRRLKMQRSAMNDESCQVDVPSRLRQRVATARLGKKREENSTTNGNDSIVLAAAATVHRFLARVLTNSSTRTTGPIHQSIYPSIQPFNHSPVERLFI